MSLINIKRETADRKHLTQLMRAADLLDLPYRVRTEPIITGKDIMGNLIVKAGWRMWLDIMEEGDEEEAEA